MVLGYSWEKSFGLKHVTSVTRVKYKSQELDKLNNHCDN